MNRSRSNLLALTVALAVAWTTTAVPAVDEAPKQMKTAQAQDCKNEDFYIDGKFQVEKARAAYFDMMEKQGYPVTESLRANMWATDFGLGDFVHVGMAGVFWINEEKHGYFAHEIYLLPGQMIVEHAHVATAKVPAKMESWQVRYGSICAFGEEGSPLPAGFVMPESQEKFITVTNGYVLNPGDIRSLNRVTARHFMMAGPQGAIVSEYGTPHDGDALRFTNPSVKF